MSSAEGQRLKAHEIFKVASEDARDELDRSSQGIAFSGFSAGLTMGLTPTALAVILSLLGHGGSAHFVAALFYPIGFIAVIIGRAQLFTENTLYPVILLMGNRRYLLPTLRLWSVVWVTNVAGAVVYAVLAVKTGALRPEFVRELVALGERASAPSFGHVFWSAVFGGWMIALVAWVVAGSQFTTGQFLVIWLLTFLVGVGSFAHCIATSGEILAAVFHGSVSVGGYVEWLVAATLGNIAGGVTIVSILNYGQVRAGEE